MKEYLLLLLLLLLSFSSQIVEPAKGLENTLLLSDLSPSSFPPNFLFGASSSAFQYEGGYLADGKGLDIWDVYSHKSENIIDGSNGDLANDQYHLYEEDVNLLASLGVNSLKFSILWARILPKGKQGNINTAGINFYKNFISALLQKGIEPMVTLNHYDLPQELEDKYQGWLSPELQEEYAYFADICFKNLGDGVKYWITFNEPNLWTHLVYHVAYWPPNYCTEPHNCTKKISPNSYYKIAHNIILAHASAVNIYREKYQKNQGGKIGIAALYYWYEPLSDSIVDKLAVERALSFQTNWFLDPIVYGTYPKVMEDILGSDLPKFSNNELDKLKSAGVDFIGINHYTTNYVKDCFFSSCPSFMGGNTKEEGFFAAIPFNKNGVPIGEVTGLNYLYVCPPGMEKVLLYASKRYPNIPLYVTENGYCDHTNPNSTLNEILYDFDRINFFNDYLVYLQSAIRKGVDVRGYFAWSFLDNFEWTYGYSKRMGICHVDRATLKRIPKLSAKWYQKIIAIWKSQHHSQ